MSREDVVVHDATTLEADEGTRVPFESVIVVAAVAASGIVLATIDAVDDSGVAGRVDWYGEGDPEPIASGLGVPVGLAADGDDLVALFTTTQRALVARFSRDAQKGTWQELWRRPVASASFMLHGEPAHDRLFVGSIDGRVQVLRASDGELLEDRTAGSSSVKAVAQSRSGDRVLVADASGTVHWVSAANGANQFDPVVHAGSVTALALLSDDRYATGGDDGAVAIQRLSDLRPLAARTIGFERRATAVRTSPDAALVGTSDALLEVDLRRGTSRTITATASQVDALALLPDGTVAVGQADGTLLLVRGDRVVQTVTTDRRGVLWLAPAAGSLLLAVIGDGTLLAYPYRDRTLGRPDRIAGDRREVGITVAVVARRGAHRLPGRQPRPDRRGDARRDTDHQYTYGLVRAPPRLRPDRHDDRRRHRRLGPALRPHARRRRRRQPPSAAHPAAPHRRPAHRCRDPRRRGARRGQRRRRVDLGSPHRRAARPAAAAAGRASPPTSPAAAPRRSSAHGPGSWSETSAPTSSDGRACEVLGRPSPSRSGPGSPSAAMRTRAATSSLLPPHRPQPARRRLPEPRPLDLSTTTHHEEHEESLMSTTHPDVPSGGTGQLLPHGRKSWWRTAGAEIVALIVYVLACSSCCPSSTSSPRADRRSP